MELQDWLKAEHLDACQFKDRHGHIVIVRRLRQDLFEITDHGEVMGTTSAGGVIRHYDRYAPVFPVLADDA